MFQLKEFHSLSLFLRADAKGRYLCTSKSRLFKRSVVQPKADTARIWRLEHEGNTVMNIVAVVFHKKWHFLSTWQGRMLHRTAPSSWLLWPKNGPSRGFVLSGAHTGQYFMQYFMLSFSSRTLFVQLLDHYHNEVLPTYQYEPIPTSLYVVWCVQYVYVQRNKISWSVSTRARTVDEKIGWSHNCGPLGFVSFRFGEAFDARNILS